jgi:ornithine carbamoyltransferase
MDHADRSFEAISTKDVVNAGALSAADLARLLRTARLNKHEPWALAGALAGRAVVLLFEKPSLRTRLTFEIGATRLGAHAIYYDHHSERIGQRESVKDYARNLERWAQAIVARTYSHRTLELLGEYAAIPVINALSDAHHPCQALADALTLEERFGSLRGLSVAYVGDGNNVCHSLMQVCSKLGAHVTAVCPRGYEPDEGVVRECVGFALESGGSVRVTHDRAALRGARAIYTDTWVSMHQAGEADTRAEVFAPYQVNSALMASTGVDSVFMHCLPAHRGEEVTDEVIDAKNSLVYEQAENRLHVQNAVLVHTCGARTRSPMEPAGDRARAVASGRA